MPAEPDNRQAAREVVMILDEIAALLNVDLTIEQLSYCVSLIENGVNPESLATVIKDLQSIRPDPDQESVTVQTQSQSNTNPAQSLGSIFHDRGRTHGFDGMDDV